MIPFYSQIVNYQGEDSGFPDAEIERWQDNGCGIASLRMVLDHLKQARPSYWELLSRGVVIGGYIEAGWIHQKLLELGREYGVDGVTRRRQSYSDLVAIVKTGSLCIVSVTVGFWGGQTDPRTGQPFRPGGHLVVAYINEQGDLACHHPSSRPEGNKENWVVDAERWERSMSGNLIEFKA
jgi:hypothetical protein